MQGGYVWDWVDQALTDPKDKQRKMCYGGDFGIESGVADAQFCINGLIFANRKFHREEFSQKKKKIFCCSLYRQILITVILTYIYYLFMNSLSHFFVFSSSFFFFKYKHSCCS